MRKGKYSAGQIALALREAETGTPIADIVNKMGVSEQTFHRWRKNYDGSSNGTIRRLMELEEENRQLKQVVAEQLLDKARMQNVIRSKT